MTFDLRLPLGLMFSFFGVVLTLLGLFSEPAAYARALALNVNLWWGLVLLVFGFAMLALALRKKSGRPEGSSPSGANGRHPKA